MFSLDLSLRVAPSDLLYNSLDRTPQLFTSSFFLPSSEANNTGRHSKQATQLDYPLSCSNTATPVSFQNNYHTHYYTESAWMYETRKKCNPLEIKWIQKARDI